MGCNYLKVGQILDLISDMLRAIADYARENRAEFIRTMQEAQAQQQDSDIKKKSGGWRRSRSGPGNWSGWFAKFMRTMYRVS